VDPCIILFKAEYWRAIQLARAGKVREQAPPVHVRRAGAQPEVLHSLDRLDELPEARVVDATAENLDPKLVEYYRTNGFVKIPGIISKEEAASANA